MIRHIVILRELKESADGLTRAARGALLRPQRGACRGIVSGLPPLDAGIGVVDGGVPVSSLIDRAARDACPALTPRERVTAFVGVLCRSRGRLADAVEAAAGPAW